MARNHNHADKQESPDSLPLFPLKNATLFPGLIMPLSAGRMASVAAVGAAMETPDKKLIIVSQRDASVEEPGINDIYNVATLAEIKKLARSKEGLELFVQGLERVVILKLEKRGDPIYLQAKVRPFPLPSDTSPEVEALERSILDMAQRAFDITEPQLQLNINQMLGEEQNPLSMAYLTASLLFIDVAKRQAILEAPTRLEALQQVYGHLSHEIQVLDLRQKIAKEAATEMGKEQRDYMLRQQLHAIQDELGEKSPEKAGVEMLRQRMQEAELPDEVRKEAERELSRLERLPSVAPDYQLITSYIELILELPWRHSTPVDIDMARTRAVLNEDHFDLDDVKARILEFLAVMKLNPKAHAPILCLSGPPGVGKTSLGQSIARAVGRKFERMSLGGLHDEAELRGHRRTYIGALPGRIIQAIRRAGVNNPLLMLDEVDKMGHDFRGDPAAALLEILDPAQNFSFRDNYLDLPFDLSKVFFITTANTTDKIPHTLLDRMEVLRLTGYSHEEKAVIASRYLIPRQTAEAGLDPEKFQITNEALKHLISDYTREAGVRELERMIARLARKAAQRFAEGLNEKVVADAKNLAEMLGPERHLPEHLRTHLPVGVATGLAWTDAGGEVLYVEATLLPEGEGLRLTGSLGNVMRESVKAAQSYLWAHAADLGVDLSLFKKSGIHVHVPAGAVPKDGPSAGIAMVSALASLYTKTPTLGHMAMTGEITLAGLVLPVGGIKEKVLAAHRAGIRSVILPEENRKDLHDLPEQVRKEIEFIHVENIKQALEAALPAVAGRFKSLAAVHEAT